MVGTSLEAEKLWRALQHSSVAYSYFDSADRLVLWNKAYEDLNIRIAPLLRRGVLFSELLAELILRGQVRIPPGEQDVWISERVRARRYGKTSFRQLADGRTFLAQERKDAGGGTFGFWLNVTELFDAGAFKGATDLVDAAPTEFSDPGLQDMMRSKLQTVLMTLEHLAASPDCASERSVIEDAIAATVTMGACLDLGRAPKQRAASYF